MNDDPVEPLDEQTAAGTALSHRTPPRSLTLGGVVARRASRSRAERRVSAWHSPWSCRIVRSTPTVRRSSPTADGGPDSAAGYARAAGGISIQKR